MSSSHDDLEIRIAYQDDAIEQLSQQLFAQAREIERLTERCRQLEARLQQWAEHEPNSATDDTPPHY